MSQITLVDIGNLIHNVRLDSEPELAVGPGEVLVAMEAAPINPVDFLFASGQYGVQATPGRVIGTEGVGRVLSVSEDVDASLVGSRVIVLANEEQGTWAHRTVIPARNVIRVGEHTDAAQLAQLSINPVTAHAIISGYGDLKRGSWIGQTLGNGSVGQFVTKLAKHAGYKTLSIVRTEEAAAQVKLDGGDVVIVAGMNIAGDDMTQRIKAALHGAELDLVIDGEGGSNVGALASSLRFGGHVVAYSAVGGLLPAIGIPDLILREVQISGWWVVNWIRNTSRAQIEATYAELEALLAAGVISSAVEAQYTLDEFREAIVHAGSTGRRGKILFDLTR